MAKGWGAEINDDLAARQRRNLHYRIENRLRMQQARHRQIIRRDGKHVIRLGKPFHP